jgi:hypothetical protein
LDTFEKIGALVYHERSKQVYATEANVALTDLVRYLSSACETTLREE